MMILVVTYLFIKHKFLNCFAIFINIFDFYNKFMI